MKNHFSLTCIVTVLLTLFAGRFCLVKAEVNLTDCLSVSGYLRYELGLHVAQKNPSNVRQADNNDLNLSRTFFHTEWSFRPSPKVRIFSVIRFTGDQTEAWDSDLGSYNAFSADVPDYDWTMLKVSDDEWRAEIWELFADLYLGDVWLRLGKQQIVWGEMIGARFLDAANSLDRSWNFLFEPEEFENIRIPNWSIRASYNTKQEVFSWLKDLTIEGYVTPGDIWTNSEAEINAPYRLFGFPPFFRIKQIDNRGKTEYGIRLGGMIGGLYATLNYMCLYNDGSNFEFAGLVPDPVNGIPILAAQGDNTRYALRMNAEHKKIDLYGMSANFAWGDPFNLVANYEGIWIPNQPYGDANSLTPASIKDQGTWRHAIRFDRPTRVFPATFLHSSMTMFRFQFTQTIVEGDEDRILGGANSKIDKTIQAVTFQVDQPFWHNDYRFALQVIYDTDDAYLIKPSLNYTYGDHWYFDIWAVFLGGSEKRPNRFGNLYWVDTVYGRITYQF